MPTEATSAAFTETFDRIDRSLWYICDFTMEGDWIDTAWEADNITLDAGRMRLELNTQDRDGKDYTGAEIQTTAALGYGSYSVRMQASGEAGVNSNFFTYTGPWFGDAWNEIDIEILGSDPTQVWLAYHSAGGSYGKVIDLGFDASQGLHDYSFVWEPNSIRWYVDGSLVHQVVNPALAVPDTPGKLMMNIWTGLPDWMGTPDFADATASVYDSVSFTPWDGDYSHALPHLRGTRGDDRLVGTPLPEAVSARAGDDTVVGAEGLDLLRGQRGRDFLHGRAGDDALKGGAGRDVLKGGAGADVLEGSGGRDVLCGGSGADTFVFGAPKHSATGAPDRIRDWDDADVIDLSGIDADRRSAEDDAFVLLPGEVHSGDGGTLRIYHANGDTFIGGDVTGDGRDDIAIRLDGHVELTAQDFVL